jgi:hypothetical protein
MAVPQLQTDQTGHRNKARIRFIKETAFDALATICYWRVRSGQELVKFIGNKLSVCQTVGGKN